MAEWIKVAHVNDVSPGRVKQVEAQGKQVVLANVNGEFHAIENLCTHDNGPLGEGELEGELIECPRHGARFNVKTGQAVVFPAVVPVRTFPVKVTGTDVFVQIN